MSEFFIIKLSSILTDKEKDEEIKVNIEIIEGIHSCKIKSIDCQYVKDDFAKGLISVILYK